jgi:hypothetical protein
MPIIVQIKVTTKSDISYTSVSIVLFTIYMLYVNTGFLYVLLVLNMVNANVNISVVLVGCI